MSDEYMTNLQAAGIQIHEMYSSFIEAGFNEEQAMRLIEIAFTARLNQGD